jgi:iron complex outermembrane receptor protein/outer membrane receptor for ferrienterochelin and colicins
MMKRCVLTGAVLLSACFAWGDGAVFELGEVVVRGQADTQAPVTSLDVVDAQDMRETGAQTVDQALEFLPGVYIEEGGKSTKHVNIRGFTESELKVLVDGIPANETYFRTIDLSQYPVAGVSEIKVVKGIPSVLYGANSMGGVVNIVTKKGEEEPSASGEVLVADYSTLHSAVSGGGQLSNLNVFVTYVYQSSDGYPLSDDFDADDANVGKDSPYHEDGGVRDNSDYIKRALTGKAGVESDSGRVYLSFDWHDNEQGIPVEYNRYWRYTEWKQWHLNLVGEQQAGDLLLKARAYYFSHDDTVTDDAQQTIAAGGRSWFDASTYDDYSAGGMLRADWTVRENLALRSALQYQFEQNRQRELNPKGGNGKILVAGWTDDAVYETETWDAALEAEGRFGRFTILAGVSYDLYRPLRSTGLAPGDDADALNPQAGLRCALTDEADVYVSVGRKTRFPHMKELYSQHAGGNPDLDPEYSDSVDAGFELALPNRPWQPALRVAVFYNDVHDMILSVDTADGESRYENIGRATTQGAELTVQVVPVEELELSVNGTLLDAWDEEQDRRLQQLPRTSLKARAAWHPFAGSAVFTQARYAHGAVQYLFDRGSGSEYTRDLPDYVVWDAGIEQELLKHAALIVRVDNLLDENYDLGDGPMPGRRLWAGLKVSW